MKISVLLCILACVALVAADVYYKETFDDSWESRWVRSKNKEKEGTQGDWKLTAGKRFGDAKEDRGIQTTPDARFYQISSKFTPFSNKGKTLIVQFSAKHEQNIDCGGGYIKLLPADTNQENFGGDSPYFIMFGPDICGSTRKTHLIFNYKGTNHLIKKEIRTESDDKTHLYTLYLNPDNTYAVHIDGKEVVKGSLKEDWDMLPPKEIKDPNAKKPADWVDEKEIADPEDKKPEGWDSIPKEIADPTATKPEDWDDDLDGEWEAPTMANPDYKGEWRARMIPNPEYKGEWIHPLVANPDYFDDDNLYAYENIGTVGFELWQVKSGTIFDNILLTDDAAEAENLAKVTKALQDAERQAEEEERKQREEEQKRQQEEEEKNKAAESSEEKDEL